MAETLKFGNLTIHFLGSNAAQLKSMYNGLYGSAVANTGSPTFRNTISETARYFRNIYVGGSLQDLEEVPGYKDARINPKEVQTRPAFGRPISADTYAMVVTGKEHTLAHGGRTFPGTTELAMAHEFMHPIQLVREWAQTGLPFRRDDTGGPETQVQMREQRIAVELGKVPGRDFPDIIGTETGYEVHLKSPESRPRSPMDDKVDPIRPQPGLPPIDGGMNQRTPANDAPAKHGALGQIRAAALADGKTADRLSADTAVASNVGRPLALSSLDTAKLPGPHRNAAAARMAEIRTLMGDRHSEYWRGPKADALQQEYRDLVEAGERDGAFRQSVALSPEAASTLIGSSINADAQPDIGDSALADRMAEIQTLMADQHSDYWRGPKAEAFQQEYRDLIDMRDRRKKREEEFLDDYGI